MATSTDIQYLGGVGDPTSGNDASQSYRTQIETFLAAGAIAVGDCVAFDTSKTGYQQVLYVIEATEAAGSLAVGIALTAAAAAGDPVQVCVAGYCAVANVATGVTAGQRLYQSSTAGRLIGTGVFLSTEITGDGNPQSTAHGLGVVPSLAFAVPTELTGGAFDVVYGTHTATNVIFTVTSLEKYRAVAMVNASTPPVAVALSAESGNLAEVLVIKQF